MILVDQMRFPRFDYGADHGFADPLKKILGFREQADHTNEFKKFFPGLTALTKNTVVLNNHKTASAACVPSRTVLFTGQYGTKTGSVQTDGVFKDGVSEKFPWLNPEQFPTLGHWMRGHGYSSHYFGKWHISGEETTNLNAYGFSDWELSYPDPHGTLPNNLGYYRDYQFEDIVCSFLRRQGLGIPFSVEHAKANVHNSKHPHLPEQEPQESTPWFAVSSFTNPHDIGAYPGIPSRVCDEKIEGAEYALAVPPHDSLGAVPENGTMAIKLNRHNFPQNNANVPLTWEEDLSNKPDCQADYAIKMGLALSSKAGRLASEKAANLKNKISDLEVTPQSEVMSKQQQLDIAVKTALNTDITGLPFALTKQPEVASRSFMQYYGYLMHEVDQHIHGVLKTLEESGQADNTIVLFCADHGEYGASHGMMMEKWHSAYEEIVHVPMLVRFPENMHTVEGGLKQISDITSHIDLLPTILGLTGADDVAMADIKAKLQADFGENAEVLDPVGIDLSGLIRGETASISDGQTEREGVLFITHDTITEPFEDEKDVMGQDAPTQYEVYKASVEALQNPESEYYKEEAANISISPQSVCHPNHVHCAMSTDNWKLARYFQPTTNHPNDYNYNNQFELYDLNNDPNEINNLAIYHKPELTIVDQGNDADTAALQVKADDMMKLLLALEEKMLHLNEQEIKRRAIDKINEKNLNKKLKTV